MIPDKLVMLEHINTAIKKNWCKKNPDIFDNPVTSESTNHASALIDKNYFSNIKNVESVKKLEQRIEALEDQSDHLFYFIYFLFENFPDLVKNILPRDWNGGMVTNHEPKEAEISENSLNSDCGLQKNHPYPTRREMEVLTLLVKGYCAKEIAHMLFISETTVITHKKNLKEKFHAKNTVELISKAYTILFKII